MSSIYIHIVKVRSNMHIQYIADDQCMSPQFPGADNMHNLCESYNFLLFCELP